MKLSVQYLVAALAIGSTGAFVLPQGSVRTSPSLDATLIENWELTADGCIVGQTQGHPDMTDGEIISTSPLVKPQAAVPASFVSTRSGSQYLLGTPRANAVTQVYPPPAPAAAQPDDGSITISRETFLARWRRWTCSCWTNLLFLSMSSTTTGFLPAFSFKLKPFKFSIR